MSKAKPKPLKVLLADDHLVVRMGISSILSLEPDMVLVGEAATGIEAVNLAKTAKPDIVLMDIMMPKLGGAEATAQIKARQPNTRILVLTSFPGSGDVRRALEAGADGAIVKSSSQWEIIAAIRRVAAGERVIASEIASDLSASANTPELSARQLEVLQLVAKGFTNGETGKILGISVNVVKDHLKLIFDQLNAASRTEAVATALSLGLIKG